MKVVIHDLASSAFASLGIARDGECAVVSDDGSIRHCIGCFGCWVKTPGKCVLKDGYENMGRLLSRCDELVIISRCAYGSYSPFVRNVLDRCIPYILPYFTKINGETHHQRRYDSAFRMTVHFYGEDITEAERETAKALAQANGVNFYATTVSTFFHEDFTKIEEASA